MTRIPAFLWFVSITGLLAFLSLVGLHRVGMESSWAGEAQIVVLFATVVMLVVVWVQLAVQTVIAIIGTAQEEGVRQARARLFDVEKAHAISKLCSSPDGANKWQKDWKDDADRVSQSWNTVGYLLQRDLVANLLVRKYISATRSAILKSRHIAQPRIAERRNLKHGGQPDLWEDFDWLARKAAGYLKEGELQAWELPGNFRTLVQSSSLGDPCASHAPQAPSRTDTEPPA